jgi:hypothetical protein
MSSRGTTTCLLVEYIRRRFHSDKIVRHFGVVHITITWISTSCVHLAIRKVVAGYGTFRRWNADNGNVRSVTAIVTVFAAS